MTCTHGRAQEELTLTQNAQPAILAHSMAVLAVLQEVSAARRMFSLRGEIHTVGMRCAAGVARARRVVRACTLPPPAPGRMRA